MTPEREEALRRVREWIALAERGDPAAYDGPTLEDIRALAADLEAAERDRAGYLRDFLTARERSEAAERERDEARDTKNLYKDRYQEAERDLATAREALEKIIAKNPRRFAYVSRYRASIVAVARAALRSLGES